MLINVTKKIEINLQNNSYYNHQLKSSNMSSTLAPFAFVHAGTRNTSGESVGSITMTARIKSDFLAEYPGARLEFRKTERLRSGDNAHVFWVLIPRGTETRYQPMLEKIGNDFYQGNGFAVYKWKQREAPTPPASCEPARNQVSRVGYKISSTWGAELAPEIAATVMHFPRRAK